MLLLKINTNDIFSRVSTHFYPMLQRLDSIFKCFHFVEYYFLDLISKQRFCFFVYRIIFDFTLVLQEQHHVDSIVFEKFLMKTNKLLFLRHLQSLRFVLLTLHSHESLLDKRTKRDQIQSSKEKFTEFRSNFLFHISRVKPRRLKNM